MPVGSPCGASGKDSACQCRRHKKRGFNPWVGKIPWRKKMAIHASVSCLENSMDRGAWWATVHGVAKSQTRLRDFTFPIISHLHGDQTPSSSLPPLQTPHLPTSPLNVLLSLSFWRQGKPSPPDSWVATPPMELCLS